MTQQNLQTLVDKAAPELAAQYRQFLNEEEAGNAEKLGTLIGRSLIDWQRQCNFNPDFLPAVAAKIDTLVGKTDTDLDIDTLTMLNNMTDMFINLLGTLASRQHASPMHEMVNDEIFAEMEKGGYFEQKADERIEKLLGDIDEDDLADLFDEDEEDDDDNEDCDDCCDDIDCFEDEDEA